MFSGLEQVFELSKESWQSERPLDDSAVAARQRMRDAVEESLPSLYLTVSDDFLIPDPRRDRS
jgi:hypothetical protein